MRRLRAPRAFFVKRPGRRAGGNRSRRLTRASFRNCCFPIRDVFGRPFRVHRRLFTGFRQHAPGGAHQSGRSPPADAAASAEVRFQQGGPSFICRKHKALLVEPGSSMSWIILSARVLPPTAGEGRVPGRHAGKHDLTFRTSAGRSPAFSMAETRMNPRDDKTRHLAKKRLWPVRLCRKAGGKTNPALHRNTNSGGGGRETPSI